MKRLALACVLVLVALLFSAQPATARMKYPWSLGLRLDAGYASRAPYESLTSGPFVLGAIELRYTLPVGVGFFGSIGTASAFHSIEPNPFGYDTKLFVMPVEFGLFYEYHYGRYMPFGSLSTGYSLWVLDREGYADTDSIHRMNSTFRAGLYYEISEHLYAGGNIVIMFPNLLPTSERVSLWGGVEASVIWRF